MHEVDSYRGPACRPAAQPLRDVIPVQVLESFADYPDPALIAERTIPGLRLDGTQDQANDGEPVNYREVRHVGVRCRFQTAADTSSLMLGEVMVMRAAGLITDVWGFGLCR
jgi:hypothetical protein